MSSAARAAAPVRAIGARAMSSGSAEWFPDVSKVDFEGADSKNPLSFKHYNAKEVVAGRVSPPLAPIFAQPRIFGFCRRFLLDRHVAETTPCSPFWESEYRV